jgi:hypothetical protein
MFYLSFKNPHHNKELSIDILSHKVKDYKNVWLAFISTDNQEFYAQTFNSFKEAEEDLIRERVNLMTEILLDYNNAKFVYKELEKLKIYIDKTILKYYFQVVQLFLP